MRGPRRAQNWNINYRPMHSSGRYIWRTRTAAACGTKPTRWPISEGAVFDMHHLYDSLQSQFKD